MLYLTTWREMRKRKKRLRCQMRDIERNGYLSEWTHGRQKRLRWLHP